MMHKIELSALWTALGIIVLFSMAIGVTLIAPEFVDPSWKQASSTYQVQMHEVSDPNVYISTSNPASHTLQYVYHLKSGFTLLAFREGNGITIEAPEELQQYVTKEGEPLKLTTRMLLLEPIKKSNHYRLYDPKKSEVFAITQADGTHEPWSDSGFTLLGEAPSYSIDKGSIYVNNPQAYRVSKTLFGGRYYWLYDENGEPIEKIEELTQGDGQFLSRASLINMGEQIYRVEGCWYCHTDQTRTLVQDVVLNGAPDFPAPPSSANEYVYQRVTFPGTRRIGPDISRVGIKRPHRDWHASHFWAPKLESKGSVMPAFGHFFDNDPTGTARNPYGVPNYKFEAIYQYLMTKGTRITPPTQAWWLGKDPVQTLDLINER